MEGAMVVKKKVRRNRKGSGCVYRPKFRTKDGQVRFGGWRIKYTWNHVPCDEAVDVETKQAAQEILKQRFAEMKSGTFVKGSEAETLTYETMRSLLFRQYEIEGRKSLWTAKDGGTKYIGHLKHLDEFFQGRLALDIDATLLDKFIEERQKEGAANGTINRALGLLRRMFHLAVSKKKLQANHVPEFTLLKEALPRKGFLEPEDFPRLRQHLPEYLRPILTLAFYTGMRLGEIRSLTWDRVDLFDGILHLEETKNGDPRNVVLNPETLEMFKVERLRFPGCPWVFSRDGTTPIQSFRKAWKSGCDRAGLMGRKFHDLRRTGARNLVRAGVPESVAMKVGGWRTRSVFERYNVSSDRDLKEASRKVTAYVEEAISQRLVKVDEEQASGGSVPKAILQ